MNSSSFICLLTGPSGAGKSIIARQLAARYPACAHIEVDVVRSFIASGKLSPFEDGGADQLLLASKIAAGAALELQTAGFNVIIDECVVAKARLDQYFRLLGAANFQAIAIVPTLAQALERNNSRDDDRRMSEEQVSYVYRQMSKRFAQEQRWQVIDTSMMTADDVVDELYDRLKHPVALDSGLLW
jgi:predicted kinase